MPVRMIRLFGLLAGVVLLLAGCGGADPGRGSDPALPESPTAKAQDGPEAWTVETTGLTPGGAFGITLTVEPSASGKLSVSFAESEVVEGGPMWRASVWSAVVMASLLLGVDPTAYAVTVDDTLATGDGPSAGALATVAVLAALRRDEIRQDAAMTGAINPDGTIGPVGGIPNKIQAAVDAGKTLVLVPASQRFDIDILTGEAVDLVELGASLAAEVRPVSTVYEAYEVLTGETLPRPAGAGSAEMSADAFAKLKAAATEWLGRYEAARNRFAALPQTLGYEQDILMAGQMAAGAESALRQGLAAVAYERAFNAGATAEGALQAVALADAYFSGGMEGLIAEVSALSSVETRLAATLGRLEAETPRSATDILALADAYASAAVAFGLVNDADSQSRALDQPGITEEEALPQIVGIATSYTRADFSLDAAENSLVYGLGFGQSAPPDPEVITAIAETLRRAADANFAVIDGYLGLIAEKMGVTLDQARMYFALKDADLRAAFGADFATSQLAAAVKEEPQSSIAVLGSSLAAWSHSSVVITKYYSLAPELDNELNIMGFRLERALSDMLDLGDDRAEELIALVGEEKPVSPLYYHENARSYREGSQFDKITALSYNWRATLLAQALAYFSGAYQDAIREVNTMNRITFLLSLIIVSVMALAVSCDGGADTPKTDMASVQESDLAAMVMDLHDLGPQFGQLEMDPDSGYSDNEATAEETLDPDDTADDLGRLGRLGGYSVSYTDPDLTALEAGEGVVSLSLGLDLFQDRDGASSFLKKQLDDFQRMEGESLENGMAIDRVQGFSADLADDAAGLRVTASYEGTEFYQTVLAFRLDRLVAATLLYRADDADAASDLEEISGDLERRIVEVSRDSATVTGREEPAAGSSGGTVDDGMAGQWRIYSETLYYDAGGSGGSDSSASSTRKLVLREDGVWEFGSSEGEWYVAPVEEADWALWDIQPYGPERKVVLEDWNDDVAEGPIEEDSRTVDFFWVIYHVDDPTPGSVWMKLGRP